MSPEVAVTQQTDAGAAGTVLLVTNHLSEPARGGRELLCRLNCEALRDLFGQSLRVLEVRRRPVRGVRGTAAAFSGHIDGVSRASIDELVDLVARERVQRVFFDGSNLGELVRVVKKTTPSVKVVTFFHNVEARFFLGSFRQQKTPRALAILLANALAERKAVRHSDRIVTLSERDSRLLRRLYGRGATDVAPLALSDQLSGGGSRASAPTGERHALFVGGNFYANRAGLEWYATQVAPRSGLTTYVVGRGFEGQKEALERGGRIRVIGPVDRLAPWYEGAHVVVAPIFDGSGMKTKVAEALMYGKRVVGTPEAFSGYEGLPPGAGWVCSSADEFVDALAEAARTPLPAMDQALRDIYLAKYSFAAARSRLEGIMDRLKERTVA